MTDALTVNEQLLATVMVDKHVVARFAAAIKANHPNGWPVKLCGVKPSNEAFMAAALFSKKNSVSEAGFVALNMRPAGCSITQLGYAFNCGPARNHRSALIQAGYFKGALANGSYTLEITKKGAAFVAKRLAEIAALDAVGNLTPAAAPSKPTRKPRPVKASTPAPATVDASAATPSPLPAMLPVTPAPADVQALEANNA